MYLNNVDIIDPSAIKWNLFYFHRNNQNYKMLLNICYFILDGLLLTTEKGKYKMATFSDDHMNRLFERFVLEYYRYHYPSLYASPSQIKWNLDNNMDENVIKFLPIMQTDIMLQAKGKTLIIDTKYYSSIMQTQYNKQTIHSGNLYQIFTYVKNKDSKNTGDVSGILLYAKTNESIAADCSFYISGNKISVKTLDLNIAFPYIATQLDKIAEEYFESKKEK